MLIRFVTNVEWIIFDSHIFDYSSLTSNSILIYIIPSNIPILDPNRKKRMKYI